jgi:hypothetical protein
MFPYTLERDFLRGKLNTAYGAPVTPSLFQHPRRRVEIGKGAEIFVHRVECLHQY